ncbi:NUDIX domain-containing protein [Thermobifida halotolerans]|uniref:NUDIX domain-containing protein n=1 Tax=Thermobifida halotolerans TaxID=483545 RepID=UPI001B87D9D9
MREPERGELLLVARRRAGLRPPAGGHVEPGEDPWDTVVRECAEELALTARPCRTSAPCRCSPPPTAPAAHPRPAPAPLRPQTRRARLTGAAPKPSPRLLRNPP